MLYTSGLDGKKELDLQIAAKIADYNAKKVNIPITQMDIDYIDETIKYFWLSAPKKRSKPYVNDREILFILLCMYKFDMMQSYLVEGSMKISRRRHYIANNNKNHRRQKRKIKHNFNNIAEMAKVKSYEGSLERFKQRNSYIEVEDDKGKNCYWLKLNITETPDDEVLFYVKNLRFPIDYLIAWETNKKLDRCVVCGSDFPKIGNGKTCDDECKETLKYLTKSKHNDKAKKEVS